MKMTKWYTKICLAVVTCALAVSCQEKDSNDWLYNEGNGNSSITNITAQSGYGYALLKWELPQSSELTMINVSWMNVDNEEETRKLTRFEDSLYLDLEMKDYVFKFISRGVSGHEHADSVAIFVPDWRTEPVTSLQNMTYSVIENGVYLKWDRNNERAYAKSTFQLFDENDEIVVSGERKKEESVNMEFADLKYNTNYTLLYYSENYAGLCGDTVTYALTTDRKAPEMPTIEIFDRAGEIDGRGQTIVTTVYAHSTEIKWVNNDVDIDSLRISFPGMEGTTVNYYFKASDEAGHLSLLPGGSVALSVSIKMSGDTEWSPAKAQSITTKNVTDTYVFRLNNGPEANNSKLGETFGQDYSGMGYAASKAYAYSLFVEKCSLQFDVRRKPLLLDELELFPTIQTLFIGGTGEPTGNSTTNIGTPQGPPVLDEFIKAVKRLPKLKQIKIRDSYHKEMRRQIVEEFTNKDKYPHLTVTNPSGVELQIVGNDVVTKN
ncbi:MAG: hypothetical protein ACRDDZ_04790 [Marinifilaceae bacterium]